LEESSLYPAGRAELLPREFAGAIPKVRESDGRVAVKLLLSNGDVRPLDIAFNIPNDVIKRTRGFKKREFKDPAMPSFTSLVQGIVVVASTGVDSCPFGWWMMWVVGCLCPRTPAKPR